MGDGEPKGQVSEIVSFRALPEKKYFKIGEVSSLVGVEPHVLRYWETQFPQVRPHKARSGHRLYRRREVETLLAIRELLHVQRFTIAGAKQALRQPGATASLLPRFFSEPGSLAERAAALAAEKPSEQTEDLIDDVDDDALDALGGDDDAMGLDAADASDATDAMNELDEASDDIGRSQQHLHVSQMAFESLSSSKSRSVQKHLVEAALADARAILAILDRDDDSSTPLEG